MSDYLCRCSRLQHVTFILNTRDLVPLARPVPEESMLASIKSFFGSQREYAVLGATRNSSKFGFKILNWYVNHDLPVVPINPKEEEILGQKVVPSIIPVLVAISEKKDIPPHALSGVDGLSISFLTPPRITLSTLDEIGSLPDYRNLVRGVWFQPGSYDQPVLDKVAELGLSDRAVHADECILVRGESGLYSSNL